MIIAYLYFRVNINVKYIDSIYMAVDDYYNTNKSSKEHCVLIDKV